LTDDSRANVRSTRLGRAPWGLFGMLILVFLVEGHVARRPLDFLDPDDWAFREARRAAGREAKRADVLILGDSLVKLGVVPRAVEERSGRRVTNLALSGSQATTSEIMFRRALKAGARPAAVVVDFFPSLQSVGPRHTLKRWSSLLGAFGAAELAWSAGDPALFGSVALARLLPTFKGRDAVVENVRAALEGRSDSRRWANTLTKRNWLGNGGAQLVPPSADVARMTDADFDAWRQKYFEAFRCAPVNDRAIGRLLALADAHNVPVYWLLPPYSPGLSAKCEASGFEAAHRAYVRSWQERFPGLTVIDARDAVPDPTVYHDPHHLGAPGAYGFSLALGNLLRRELHSTPGASRWLTLRPCRPVSLPAGVEDLDASHLALENLYGRARR
jgi:hypothetical protein